jgi:hypothetical protein
MPKDEFPGRPPREPDRAGSNGGDGDDDGDVLEWMDQHVAAEPRGHLPTDSQASGGDGDDGDDDVLEWMDQHVAAGTRSHLPTDSQVSVAGLFGTGTPLYGVVAKNFLEVHRIAQRQLNFYFVEPLVTNYLLNAERTMEKTKEDQELATQDQEVDQAARIRDQLVEAMLDAARAGVTLGKSVAVAEPADGTKDSAGGRNARMTQTG